MVKKGRSRQGTKNITKELKEEILSLKGIIKIREISEKYNLHVRTIQKIFGHK